MPANTATLTALCLEHLEHEAVALCATLEALRQTHAALVGGGTAAVEEALRHQAALGQTSLDVSRLRANLRATLAAGLGCPPAEATLDALACTLSGEERVRLDARRQRVRELAAEAHQLNQILARLAFHCLDFLSQFLGEVTGAVQGGGYRRGGRPEGLTCEPLIEARG